MLPVIFITITLLSIMLLFKGSGNNRRVLWFYSIWLILAGALAYSGYLQNTKAMPPRALWVLLTAILSVVFLVFSFRKQTIKTNYLLAIHAIRLPVELTLYQLYLHGKVPIEMTFKGWNFDILIGISAIMLLLNKVFSQKNLNPILLKAWNVVGIVLLAVIVITAILSAPLPFQQLAFNQPNIAILEFPYVYLPGVVVPIVLVAHIMGLRK